MPGLQEWLIIAVLALVVFGPDRLPELARTAGRMLARVRSETQRNVDELKRMSEVQELRAELRGLEREFRDTAGEVRSSADIRGPAGKASSRASGAATSERDPALVERTSPPPTDPEAT